MTTDERGNVAAFRCPLPVSADKMDPLDQIEAMVAGVTEVELTDHPDTAEEAPPPDLLERVLAVLRGPADASAEALADKTGVAEHPHDATPAACYVDPVRLARIRRGLRNTTNAPEEFSAAVDELVEDWPSIAVGELVFSYSLHSTPVGAPYDAERCQAIAEAIAGLGPAAIEGILRALTIEERPDRVVAAIALSPVAAADPCIRTALAQLVNHARTPVSDYAAEALGRIEAHWSRPVEAPKQLSDTGA